MSAVASGLVAAVQAAHTDLKAQKGVVLVTGGGLALEQDDMAAAAASWGLVTLGVAKAAQRKLVHIMHKALAADGIYVGEVTVMGGVSGKIWHQLANGTCLRSMLEITDTIPTVSTLSPAVTAFSSA
jgi:hypothetical protein